MFQFFDWLRQGVWPALSASFSVGHPAFLATPGMAGQKRDKSSIGFMGVFGRSSDLRQLDQALRAVDLHPKMVPEAVKLTTCALLKDEADSNDPPPEVYRPAAEIIA